MRGSLYLFLAASQSATRANAIGFPGVQGTKPPSAEKAPFLKDFPDDLGELILFEVHASLDRPGHCGSLCV